MRLLTQIATVAFLLMLFLAIPSCHRTETQNITIGAMPPGTSWYVFAATLANLLQPAVPAGTRVEVVARGGGVGNPILVDRGDETIALAQTATAAWAYNGHRSVYKGKRYQNIRALAGGLNSVWMVALLREEYIARTGHTTLKEALLSDHPVRIVMKPQESTVPVVADIVFETLGTSREKIISKGGEIIQVATNQIATILRDGRADLYFETAVQGHPALTEVTTTVDMRFLDYPKEVIATLVGPGVNEKLLPKWFRGQTAGTRSVDMGTVLIANKDLSDDLAYLITKTVCENKDEMAKVLRAWQDFEPQKGGLLENTGVPLHPGAERYYREMGWL